MQGQFSEPETPAWSFLIPIPLSAIPSLYPAPGTSQVTCTQTMICTSFQLGELSIEKDVPALVSTPREKKGPQVSPRTSASTKAPVRLMLSQHHPLRLHGNLMVGNQLFLLPLLMTLHYLNKVPGAARTGKAKRKIQNEKEAMFLALFGEQTAFLAHLEAGVENQKLQPLGAAGRGSGGNWGDHGSPESEFSGLKGCPSFPKDRMGLRGRSFRKSCSFMPLLPARPDVAGASLIAGLQGLQELQEGSLPSHAL